MPFLANLEQFLSHIEPWIVGLLLVRVLIAGLGWKYRWFSTYLVLWLAQDLVPIVLGMRLDSNAYAYFYFASDPILWVLYVLTVLELFNLVFHDFKGIESAGRFFVKISIPISIVLAVVTSLPSLNPQGSQWILELFLVAQRTVVFSILFWLAMVVFFLTRYRLALPRNTILYATGYLIFFAAKGAVVALAVAIHLSRQELWNTILQVVSLACLTVWVFAFNRQGEYATVVAGPPMTAAKREKLRLQFLAVNDKLSSLLSSRTGAR